MAIIVQEEKKPANWFLIVVATVFTTLIFSAVYFLFFAQPPFIEYVIPIKLQQATELSKLSLDPNPILNSEVFKRLRKYAPPPTPGELGRSAPDNPFLPF